VNLNEALNRIGVNMTYCGSEVGRNRHELLMAPKPDRNPRITVPTTMSRERYVEKVPEGFSDEGRGT
jgi:hypothetical protein